MCWDRECCAKLESTRWHMLAMVVRRRRRDDETMTEWAVDRARRVKEAGGPMGLITHSHRGRPRWWDGEAENWQRSSTRRGDCIHEAALDRKIWDEWVEEFAAAGRRRSA